MTSPNRFREGDDPRKRRSVEAEEPDVHRVRDHCDAEEQIRAEVDEEDLHDDRSAATDDHVQPRQEPEQPHGRHPHQRCNQTE